MFDFCHSILDKQPWILVKDWKIFVGVVALKMYSSQKSEATCTVWMVMIILIIVADSKLYRKPLFWMQMLFERSCRYIMTACVPGTVTVMRNRAGFYGFCGSGWGHRLTPVMITDTHPARRRPAAVCVWERETDSTSSRAVGKCTEERHRDNLREREGDRQTVRQTWQSELMGIQRMCNSCQTL